MSLMMRVIWDIWNLEHTQTLNYPNPKLEAQPCVCYDVLKRAILEISEK
jgi:hypothetical protein